MSTLAALNPVHVFPEHGSRLSLCLHAAGPTVCGWMSPWALRILTVVPFSHVALCEQTPLGSWRSFSWFYHHGLWHQADWVFVPALPLPFTPVSSSGDNNAASLGGMSWGPKKGCEKNVQDRLTMKCLLWFFPFLTALWSVPGIDLFFILLLTNCWKNWHTWHSLPSPPSLLGEGVHLNLYAWASQGYLHAICPSSRTSQETEAWLAYSQCSIYVCWMRVCRKNWGGNFSLKCHQGTRSAPDSSLGWGSYTLAVSSNDFPLQGPFACKEEIIVWTLAPVLKVLSVLALVIRSISALDCIRPVKGVPQLHPKSKPWPDHWRC